MKAIPNILAGLTLCAAISPAAAMASDRKPIDRREHNEQVRIHQGIRSGELTRKEAARLEAEQARIRVDERFAKMNGKFTAEERLRIQKELSKASHDIYQQKHDAQDRK